MYDVVIRGGDLVDGTGAPRRRADVAIQGDRIVAIGAIDDPAATVIDATGKVVTPGFVDVHTHYDAQVFWDGALTPSPLHGVTTALAGNCGFTIAPLSDDPSDGDYLMRMLARVEGMPLESLRDGVPWNWKTTAEYFDQIEGRLGINAGFMVGHSAIRRIVMGEESTTREAKPEEIEQMQALLRAGLEAGATGFSSSWARTHNDADGHMVPVALRVARRDRHAVRDGVGVSRHVARVHPHGRPQVRAVGGGVDGRHVGRRATATQLERHDGQRQEPRRLRVEARSGRPGAGEGRPGGRAHRADELPGALVVPLGIRARRHPRLGRPHAPAARPEARAVRGPRRAGPPQRARAERHQPAPHPRQLGQPEDLRRARVRERAVPRPHGRRDRDRRGPRPVGRAVRHRPGRRAQHQLRYPGRAGDRRRLEGPHPGVARPARAHRRVRRRRPPRPPRVVQLLHRGAGPRGA